MSDELQKNEGTSKIKETKEKKETKKATKSVNTKTVLKTVKYTEEELFTFIRNNYSQHNQYYKVLKNIVDTICDKELKELNAAIADLEKKLKDPRNMTGQELTPFVVTIPILMYKVNAILGEQALNMEITQHLNNMEITEKLSNIFGGTEKERIRQAEYESMISTFTLLVKSRVYYNIKNTLDYASKLNDGVKKALSAYIEEIKVFGKESSGLPNR